MVKKILFFLAGACGVLALTTTAAFGLTEVQEAGLGLILLAIGLLIP